MIPRILTIILHVLCGIVVFFFFWPWCYFVSSFFRNIFIFSSRFGHLQSCNWQACIHWVLLLTIRAHNSLCPWFTCPLSVILESHPSSGFHSFAWFGSLPHQLGTFLVQKLSKIILTMPKLFYSLVAFWAQFRRDSHKFARNKKTIWSHGSLAGRHPDS